MAVTRNFIYLIPALRTAERKELLSFRAMKTFEFARISHAKPETRNRSNDLIAGSNENVGNIYYEKNTTGNIYFIGCVQDTVTLCFLSAI